MNIDDALSAYRGELLAAAGRWHASRRNRRRRRVVATAAPVAVLAAVLAATPARALVHDVLPFWDQPSAPQSVRVDFSSLNTGAPSGMSPQAAGGETREVAQATFGGKTHTLYVSPAKNGGYCELWTDASGGCNTAGEPLTWGGIIVPSHDASQPPATRIPKSDFGRMGALEWLTGSVLSPSVSDVVIRFSDGTAVQPSITWVSAPIGAGFFAYDVPNGEQSAGDHVTEIDAYDANGGLVKREQMPVTLPPQPAG
ncbi:MAG: hypothetical protein ACRDKC_03165 [Gaiellaceae bacterium]